MKKPYIREKAPPIVKKRYLINDGKALK